MKPHTRALLLIAAERERQVSAEGWTTAHDDQQATGELASAAACYAGFKRPAFIVSRKAIKVPPRDWPWESHWWKPTPKDRIRELVKAGALIVAEIERLQRRDAK